LLALEDQLGVVEKPVLELRAEALGQGRTDPADVETVAAFAHHLDVLEPEYSVLVVRQSGDRCLK
jgi:hypothetical protein